MAPKTDVNQTQTIHGSQRSQRNSLRMKGNYQLPPSASSSSNYISKQRSSDSASTATAVTAPEDDADSSKGSWKPSVTRPYFRRSQSRNAPDATIKHVSSTTSGTVAYRRDTLPENVTMEHGRKDKGKGIDRPPGHSPLASSRHILIAPVDVAGKDKFRHGSDTQTYSGPLAQAEFERMRKEIDNLKKAASSNQRLMKKQAKKIEELKAQVLAESLAKKEHETQVQTLKTNAEKQAELLTTFEHSLQCQICMELLYKPYALSPCGHILCLHCLQEWFRKAPPSVDDSDFEDEEDPQYLLTRHKSCPCCRAVVTRHPVPVFVVKSVASALAKYRASSSVVGAYHDRSPSPDESDPWRGLFRTSDDNDDDEDEDEDDNDDDDEHSESSDNSYFGLWGNETPFISRNQFFDAVASESEDGDEDEEEEEDPVDSDSLDGAGSDRYGNIYVPAQWQPPIVSIDPDGVNLQDTLSMLRRGCTTEMIDIFKMVYSHARGLIAHLPSLEGPWTADFAITRDNRVFLGWNVGLSDNDSTGELYMEAILKDLRDSPALWVWTERPNIPGAHDVKRLVSVEDIEDYDTTDTEAWLDTHDFFRQW